MDFEAFRSHSGDFSWTSLSGPQKSAQSASFLGYVSSDRSFSRKAAGPCQRILHDGIPADLCAGLIRGPASVRSPLGMDLAWSSVSHPHLIVCTCGNGTKYLCYVKPARSASLSCGTNRRSTCMDEIHRPDHGHFCSAPAFTSDSPGSASDCPVHLDIFHQAETL